MPAVEKNKSKSPAPHTYFAKECHEEKHSSVPQIVFISNTVTQFSLTTRKTDEVSPKRGRGITQKGQLFMLLEEKACKNWCYRIHCSDEGQFAH